MIHVWFGDILVHGLAGLGVLLVGCLLWVHLREKWERRKLEELKRQRQDHWGYN